MSLCVFVAVSSSHQIVVCRLVFVRSILAKGADIVVQRARTLPFTRNAPNSSPKEIVTTAIVSQIQRHQHQQEHTRKKARTESTYIQKYIKIRRKTNKKKYGRIREKYKTNSNKHGENAFAYVLKSSFAILHTTNSCWMLEKCLPLFFSLCAFANLSFSTFTHTNTTHTYTFFGASNIKHKACKYVS